MRALSRDDLIEHLTAEILAGRLAAGTKLASEREMSEEFGLSRPIVREVLRGLHEQGLVMIRPARGTFVRTPTPADGARSLDSFYRRSNATARELTEARLMLERHTARLAATTATDADVAAMEQCLIDFDGAKSILERARHDIAFHGLLARASHNTVIETMFASIVALTFELMLRSLSDREVARQGAPDHWKVLKAVKARDPDAAERAMTHHLEIAARLYGPDFDDSIDSVARREVLRLLGPQVTVDGLLEDLMRRYSDGLQGPGGRG